MVVTTMRRFAFACVILAGLISARPEAVHFLRWSDVQSLAGLAAGPARLPEVKDTLEWDNWIRERDSLIRGRIDHGMEDSISELILFGTSFSAPPKLAKAADATNAAGGLTANARARVEAFIQAIDELDTERFRIILEFLRHRQITQDELNPFLSGNLRRFALEVAGLRDNQARADVAVSPETSLLVNFAIEDTLRSLKSKHALPPHLQRIAVIGPGLDLAGDPDIYDFSPPQSIQPFAILEAALRLDLTPPADVQLTALDVNPFVLAHLRTSLTKARAGQPYLLQISHPLRAGWNAAAVGYWQHFGEAIGAPATTLTTPPGMELRTITVKPQIVARISVEDLDIVTQTLETVPGPGFDLVVATNVLNYYTRVEQMLALTSISRMLASGGILISNGLPQGVRLQEFEDLGSRRVDYSDTGAGDDLVTYKRK
jgi:hypothetical protein